jgi:hypothetical protein
VDPNSGIQEQQMESVAEPRHASTPSVDAQRIVQELNERAVNLGFDASKKMPFSKANLKKWLDCEEVEKGNSGIRHLSKFPVDIQATARTRDMWTVDMRLSLQLPEQPGKNGIMLDLYPSRRQVFHEAFALFLKKGDKYIYAGHYSEHGQPCPVQLSEKTLFISPDTEKRWIDGLCSGRPWAMYLLMKLGVCASWARAGSIIQTQILDAFDKVIQQPRTVESQSNEIRVLMENCRSFNGTFESSLSTDGIVNFTICC